MRSFLRMQGQMGKRSSLCASPLLAAHGLNGIDLTAEPRTGGKTSQSARTAEDGMGQPVAYSLPPPCAAGDDEAQPGRVGAGLLLAITGG